MNFFHLCLSFLIIYLSEKEHLSLDSLPRKPTMAREPQPKARNPIQISYINGKTPVPVVTIAASQSLF